MPLVLVPLQGASLGCDNIAPQSWASAGCCQSLFTMTVPSFATDAGLSPRRPGAFESATRMIAKMVVLDRSDWSAWLEQTGPKRGRSPTAAARPASLKVEQVR